MKKYEKLLQKLNGKSRDVVLDRMRRLRAGDTVGLNIKRIDTNYFRCRAGNYRIFFSYENGTIRIDDVKKRNEDTYSDI